MNDQHDDKQPWENWSEEDWEKNASAWDDWDGDAEAQPESAEPAAVADEQPAPEQLPPHATQPQPSATAQPATGESGGAGSGGLLKNKKMWLAVGAAVAALVIIALVLSFLPKGGGSSSGQPSRPEITGYGDAPEELAAIEGRGGLALYNDSQLLTWDNTEEDDVELWDLGSGEMVWAFDTRDLELDAFQRMVVSPQPSKGRVFISAFGNDSDGTLAVVDAGSGELIEQHVMDGYQAYAATADGSLFLLEVDEPSQADKDAGNWENHETLSKLEGTDPSKAIWTADTNMSDCSGDLVESEPVNGHLFIPNCGNGAPIVSVETGEEPKWTRENRNYQPLGTKYVLETHQGRSTILDWQGEKLWDGKPEGYVFAVGDDVFVRDSRRVGKLNVEKGEYVWEQKLPKRVEDSFNGAATPILDGKMYLAEVDDDLVELTSLDLSNGKLSEEPQIVTFADVRDEITTPAIFTGEGRLVLSTTESGDSETTYVTSVKPGAKESSWDADYDGGSMTQFGNRLVLFDFEAEEIILLG